MTPERFRELSEIYGAQPQRWPAAEREAARVYMRDHPAEAQAALTDAAALDDMLSDYIVAPPAPALRARIVASAPATRGRTWRPTGLWWQSAGLASLGLAAALAGALVFTIFMPVDRPSDDDDGGYVLTAFDELS